jgi:UDP-N-acetylmuramoyl-tripeptide--D-alanyl-D-alanine ligase
MRMGPALDGRGLAAAAGGELLAEGSAPIRGAAVDSRLVEAGNAFFALPGERTDGHAFLADAAAAGAAALVVREAPGPDAMASLVGVPSRLSVVRVADTGAALRAAAVAWRDRFDPLVIGITGSLAKTSTKEQVAEVLAERHAVLRSEGNQNNEIGLPLTLLRLGPEHTAAVLEMGLYTLGEIALLASMARPSIGIVTAVRSVHLSRAGSIEAITAGKRELVEALPADGWAVLNADDPRVLGMRGATRASVVTYGFDAAADVRADDVRSLGVEGMRFRLRIPGASAEVRTSALGRHGVHNGLAAAAAGMLAGLALDEIVRGLARGFSAPHRSQLLEAGSWRILDDSYNASPDAVRAALDLLADLPGRHVAVLGEMLELGDEAAEAHRSVGRHAAARADLLIVVGDGAAVLAEGALEAGLDASRVELVADHEAASEVLLDRLGPGDTVLVKASRGAGLERVVARLAAAAGSEGRA